MVILKAGHVLINFSSKYKRNGDQNGILNNGFVFHVYENVTNVVTNMLLHFYMLLMKIVIHQVKQSEQQKTTKIILSSKNRSLESVFFF